MEKKWIGAIKTGIELAKIGIQLAQGTRNA
jgi:hypothetical protein